MSGPINGSAVSFLSGLGRRIADRLGETREGSFLFQWLSVLINASVQSYFMTALLMGWQVIPANFVVFCDRSNF